MRIFVERKYLTMCDLNGPFKLCSCESTVNRSKPHWILHQTLILKNEENTIMGLLIGPNPFERYVSKNLKKRLNSTHVFDFEYQAQEGDCLELFTEDIPEEDFEEDELEPTHRFVFKKGKWHWIVPFDATIYQHKTEKSGTIIGPTTELTKAYEQFKKEASPDRFVKFEGRTFFYNQAHLQISKKHLLDFFKQTE